MTNGAVPQQGAIDGRAWLGSVPVRAQIASGDAWALPAEPSAVGQLRRLAAAYAAAMGAGDEMIYAVRVAVSETVTNVVIHAYAGRAPGPVTLRCHAEDERLVIVVADEGSGMSVRQNRSAWEWTTTDWCYCATGRRRGRNRASTPVGARSS